MWRGGVVGGFFRPPDDFVLCASESCACRLVLPPHSLLVALIIWGGMVADGADEMLPATIALVSAAPRRNEHASMAEATRPISPGRWSSPRSQR
jgi:hypothetical protein